MKLTDEYFKGKLSLLGFAFSKHTISGPIAILKQIAIDQNQADRKAVEIIPAEQEMAWGKLISKFAAIKAIESATPKEG
jgi:hypothetical protein